MKMLCNNCKLFAFCPEKGASPLVTSKKQILQCRLIGNFGRKPVDESILSPASLKKAEENGFCTSYVEIPKEDETSKKVYHQTTIIFHQPILHPREKPISDATNKNYRRSYKI